MQTLNNKAKRLLEIKSLMASLEKEKAELETEFKGLGSFKTEEFDISVAEQTRLSMKGVEAVSKVFGKENLEANGLITSSTFKVVRVSALEAKENNIAS